MDLIGALELVFSVGINQIGIRRAIGRKYLPWTPSIIVSPTFVHWINIVVKVSVVIRTKMRMESIFSVLVVVMFLVSLSHSNIKIVNPAMR